MRDTIFRKKSILGIQERHAHSDSGLKKVLGPWSLMAIGIGCTIGTGIFVMPGEVAAHHAGPAIVISFLLAGLASALAALSYCELAVVIPASGSTYSYAYAALGEVVAFMIGWALLLEYGLANSAVASAWGGYLNRVTSSFGLPIPQQLLYAPGQAIPGTHLVGLFNMPAALSIVIVSALLVIGIKESTSVNNLVVSAKVLVLVMFLALGLPHFNPAYMTPYMPFGWNGVVSGAATLFFVFIGFDAVTTVAEECKDPQRNLPIGVLGALGMVTVLYIAVAGGLTGLLPLKALGDASEPLAAALAAVQHPMAAWILSVVAVIGIITVLITGSIGQTRILYVMGRDGLMPRFMANVHKKWGTPVETTILLGIVTAILGAVVPLDALADLVSIGTLAAFCIVSLAVIVLRRTHPDLPRAFRCPWVPVLPLAGIAINLYLMSGLSTLIWICFSIWMAAGLAIYFLWGQRSAGRVFNPVEEA